MEKVTKGIGGLFDKGKKDGVGSFKDAMERIMDGAGHAPAPLAQRPEQTIGPSGNSLSCSVHPNTDWITSTTTGPFGGAWYVPTFNLDQPYAAFDSSYYEIESTGIYPKVGGGSFVVTLFVTVTVQFSSASLNPADTPIYAGAQCGAVLFTRTRSALAFPSSSGGQIETTNVSHVSGSSYTSSVTVSQHLVLPDPGYLTGRSQQVYGGTLGFGIAGAYGNLPGDATGVALAFATPAPFTFGGGLSFGFMPPA